MSWFIEERTPASTCWMAAVYRDKPSLDAKMRVGRTNARARSQPLEIDAEHRTLSLTRLRAIYGAEAQAAKKAEGAA